MSCGQAARAQDFNFDLITIPTDLVAAIVNTEDDISLNSVLNTNISNEIFGNSTAEADSQTENLSANPKGSSSIFSETDEEEPLADSNEDTKVAGVAAQPITASSQSNPVLQDATTSENEDTKAAGIVEKPTTVPAPSGPGLKESLPTEEEEIELQAVVVSSNKTDSTENTGSIFDNVTSNQVTETDAAVDTEQPVSSDMKSNLAEIPASDLSDTLDTTEENELNTQIATANKSALSDNENSLQGKVSKQNVTTEQEAAINEDEIIIAWATAWSNNQTEDYLSFYADNFSPSNKSLTRNAWEKQRRKRLQNKDIRIIVSNAEVFRVEGDVTEVRFTQRYTSANYRDRIIKSIEMVETEKGWQFLSERTIEKLPFE